MKKSKKFISVILALVMVISAIPLTAAGRAIDTSKYDRVEKLISNDGLYSLVEYLVNGLNSVSDDAIGSVLRLVFIFMDNEDINGLIGDKKITTLSNAETAKMLVNWLDTYVLPDLAKDLESNDIIKIINDNIPGLSVRLSSVQGAFDTLAQLDDFGISGLLYLLGDASDINVSVFNNATVKGNELTAVKKLFQFIKNNLGLIKKALNGNLSLGVLNSAVEDYLAPISELNLLIKSYLYQLIDGYAAPGEFEKGKMGGDWANSAYKNYNADQLLAAALIKFINNDDESVVTTAQANDALSLSFYGILSKYAPVLYKNFAVDLLNDNIQELVDKLNEVDPELRAQFKETMPTFDENTFADIFADLSSEGIFGQLNNIVVKIAELVLTTDTYNSLGLVKGSNSNLNDNITKICRYALPLLFAIEDQLGFTFPDTVKANYKTMSLSQMAVYILKPFFSTWFENSSETAVNSADSLADLAVLAVYYTATNSEWLDIDYDFSAIESEIFANNGTMKNLNNDACTELVLKLATGIGVGALKHNADKIYFDITVDTSDWERAINQISNWGLDLIKGLPALVKVHNIRNQDENGAFYKLNVLLNEFINFSFLNNVGSATFKFDVYTLITDALLGNLYNFDIESIVAVFEKNDNSENILNGNFIKSVLGVVDRIVTAIFEHNCGTLVTRTETVPATGSKQCTHTVTTTYTYCTVCGASSTTSKENKLATPVHDYETTKTEKVKVTATATICAEQTKTTKVCRKCGDVNVTTTTSGHKNSQTGTIPATCGDSGKRVVTCSVCDYTQKVDISSQPATGKHTWDAGKATSAGTVYTCTVCGTKKTVSGPSYSLGDVDADKDITASDARLALRRAVGLEKYAEGSAEFLACDVTKDGSVTAEDARIILRIAVKLEKISAYDK